MKPAPNATKCSIRASSRAARRVTASAPTTLPSAAMRAYPRALDTGEEVVARVTGRILEYFRQQPLEGLSHFGPGPHARGQEVVAFHRQILYGQGVLRRPNGLHDLRERGKRKGDTGDVEPREQCQQVVRVLTHLREPLPNLNHVSRIGILFPPRSDRACPFDFPVGALKPRQE